MLDSIVDRGALIRANRVFAQFRKMCRWAISRGIIDRSPCEGVTAPSPETRRERFLSDDEIRLAWAAFDSVGWPFGPIGKLLLLTGARRDEVAGMSWGEIDLSARVWSLPKERTKNKRDHVIPLSDPAVRIIEDLPHIEDKSGFIFTTTQRSPVSGFSRAKSGIDKAIVKAMKARASDPEKIQAPEHWTFHDLRRTLATNLQKIGVKLEVTEAVLNHISGEVGSSAYISGTTSRTKNALR